MQYFINLSFSKKIDGTQVAPFMVSINLLKKMLENTVKFNNFQERGGVKVAQRLTITEVAKEVGVSAKTIARWEKVGKVKRPKRDWRGWRVYDEIDLSQIKEFHETVFEV